MYIKHTNINNKFDIYHIKFVTFLISKKIEPRKLLSKLQCRKRSIQERERILRCGMSYSGKPEDEPKYYLCRIDPNS